VLTCRVTVAGVDEGTFLDIAERAKNGCPVSRALAVHIELDAALDA